MKLAVTGSSGLVGTKLTSLAEAAGHQVIRLVRRPPQSDQERRWDPLQRTLDPTHLADIDGVVHLAGESIASGRWTAARKQQILRSRVDSTRLLAETIAAMDGRPQVLVCASAIGYYGERGDEVLDETSPPGEGFLADVCRAWEEAADPCRDKTRVVHCRLGMVLSQAGGALAQMLTPFKLGVGGVIGSGKQYWSWIHREDAANVFLHVAESESIRGPVNAVAPHPVTCREFTRTLGQILHRPTLFPLPATLAKLALGEMAEELILCSARVTPQVLLNGQYPFRYPDLISALTAAVND